MLKYLIMSVMLLFVSFIPVHAQTPYHGTLTGGIAFTPHPGGDAMSTVTFDCTDPAFGHYDLCVDMVVRLYVPQVGVKMHAKFDPRLTVKNKNILMRYFVSLADGSPPPSSITAVVVGEDLDHVARFPLTKGETVTVYRDTHDGGDSWGNFTLARH